MIRWSVFQWLSSVGELEEFDTSLAANMMHDGKYTRTPAVLIIIKW